MVKQRYKYPFVLLIALVLTVIFIALSYLNLTSHWHYQSLIVKQKLQQQSQRTNADLANYLVPLNARFTGTECTPEILRAMREAEYYSDNLHEYGFLVGNELICTSNVGILDEPLIQPRADIQAQGAGISFTRLAPVGILPGSEKAVRLRVGQFQALLKSNNHSSLGYDAIVFVYDGEQFLRAYTNQYDWYKPLRSAPHADTVSTIRNGKWLQQYCYAQQTCALIKIDIKTFIKRNAIILGLTTLLIFAMMVVIFFKFYRAINDYFSFDRQVQRGVNVSQVECVYQPIIDNQTGLLSSCEVLCRWRDNTGHLHGAFPFINAVIKNNQEALLTKVVVQNAIRDFKTLSLLGKVRLSINCFPSDVASGHIEKVLRQHVPSEYLSSIVVEITEQQSSKTNNINTAIAQLRALGIKIAIDDFGTGHSNLEQLKDLKVDYLKIDQSFIIDILNNKLHRQMVELIVNLAQEMNLHCVAEGVETQEHQTLIPQLNIAYSQGYYHAKPMDKTSLKAFIEAHR